MTKSIKTFPKTISVRIEKDDEADYLVANNDSTGHSHTEGIGERIKAGIYKLDHVREVTLTAESQPLTKSQ